MSVEFRPNPNFHNDVMKATEEKIVSCVKALERGEKLNNDELSVLAKMKLIEVSDVTNHDTPPGQRDLLFLFFTEKGKAILEGAAVNIKRL